MDAPFDTDKLDSLFEIVADNFADLDFVGRNGVLDLRGDWGGAERVRVEVPEGRNLHLQSMGLTDASGADLSQDATITVSGWSDIWEPHLNPRQFFEADSPSDAATFVTAEDQLAWLEVALRGPSPLARILLRNCAVQMHAGHARGLRVQVFRNGEWRTVWNHARRVNRLRRRLRSEATPATVDASQGFSRYTQAVRRRVSQRLGGAVRQAPTTDPPTVEGPLIELLVLTAEGDYLAARAAFGEIDLDDAEQKALRRLISTHLLSRRGLEWTIHGPTRSFRFWPEEEKSAYVEFTVTIADALRELTPHVSFGFGAVLCTVRDHDLIPHDDDLDLIIAFDEHEAANLPAGLRRVEEFARERGFSVTGNFSAHRKVSLAGRKAVDVFVGLFEEGDVISWYPGPRGTLTRSLMYPTTERELCGVTVPMPNDPEEYLRRVYGDGWVTPNPEFKHTWDRSKYADLVTRGTSTS